MIRNWQRNLWILLIYRQCFVRLTTYVFWTLIFSELISVHLCRIHDEWIVFQSPWWICYYQHHHDRGVRDQELWESHVSGRPGLPVPNSPYGFCGSKVTFTEEHDEIRALELSVKVVVAVQGSPSLIVLMVLWTESNDEIKALELGVKAVVAVLGRYTSLTVLMAYVDVK